MISKTINCNVAFETLAGCGWLWGCFGGSSKNANRIFSQELTVPNNTHVNLVFHWPAESYGFFVEKLQPVENWVM